MVCRFDSRPITPLLGGCGGDYLPRRYRTENSPQRHFGALWAVRLWGWLRGRPPRRYLFLRSFDWWSVSNQATARASSSLSVWISSSSSSTVVSSSRAIAIAVSRLGFECLLNISDIAAEVTPIRRASSFLDQPRSFLSSSIFL